MNSMEVDFQALDFMIDSLLKQKVVESSKLHCIFLVACTKVLANAITRHGRISDADAAKAKP